MSIKKKYKEKIGGKKKGKWEEEDKFEGRKDSREKIGETDRR